MSPRRVLLLVVQTYPDGGGISSILENYVAELDGPYEVHVAIVEERPGRRERLRLPEERVHVLGYSNAINPLLFPTSLAFAAAVGRFLRRAARDSGADAVIVQNALNLAVPALVATAGRPARAVVMDHGTLTNPHEEGWLAMILRRLPPPKAAAFRMGFALDRPWRALRWRLGVRLADQLWYTGEELEPWFRRAGARSRRYAQSVPSDFAPATARERADARARLGLAGDDLVVNSVGRLDGEKGLDTVVDAVTALEDPGVPWRLLIAGDGSLGPWLERQIAERGLGDRVRLCGRLGRDDVRVLQHASDFHLYAGTISCGVSICLLEAMAAGVVPVVSDVPRVQRELVGDAGWVFAAGDREGLRRALQEALAAPPERRAELRERTLGRLSATREPSIPELVAELVGG